MLRIELDLFEYMLYWEVEMDERVTELLLAGLGRLSFSDD